jgi:hypothetical protein
MKIASHCVFDEAFNNVPVETLPPNIQHILPSTDKNERPKADPDPFANTNLEFYVYPFAEKELLLPPSLPTTLIHPLVSNLVLMNYTIVFMLKKLHPTLVPQTFLTTSKPPKRD